MEVGKTLHQEELDQAKEVLNQLLEAQEKGDIELFSMCFHHTGDLLNVGTDIDEYWAGWKPFFSYMKQMVTLRKGLKISSKNTKINISEHGDVAWYSQLIDTCIETKGNPFRLEGFRHTGVMEKIDGHWKIVQSHTSVAIDEEVEEFKHELILQDHN